MECKFCGKPLMEDENFCGSCGRKRVDRMESMASGSGKKAPGGLIVILVIMAVLLVCMGVSTVLGWCWMQEKLAEQETLMAEQQAKVEEMEEKCANYDVICSLNNASIGHISNEFHVTKGTVVLSKDDDGKQITLTTDWRNGASIETSYEGTSATLEFDNNRWYEKTTMTIVPRHPGVTIVTFSNDLNSERFKVLLIVTE